MSKRKDLHARMHRIESRGVQLMKVVQECDRKIKQNKWGNFTLNELRSQALKHLEKDLGGEEEPSFD